MTIWRKVHDLINEWTNERMNERSNERTDYLSDVKRKSYALCLKGIDTYWIDTYLVKGATSRITQLEKAGKFFQVCHS